jgi:Putative auto-transporter adhesin, head GIN domain
MKKVGLLIFILALTVGIVLANSLGFGSFNIIKFGSVQGSGTMKTEKRELSGFSKIYASGAVNVEISFQKDFSVEVEADDNLLENIKTVVDGDTLKIYNKGRMSTRNPINVRITMPAIEGLDVSGASKANVSNVSAESLEIQASGASKIKMTGEVKILNVDVSGASKIDAENLKVENADVDASGASSVFVSVSGQLKADASGASRISYTGNPTNVDKSTSGASSVVGK